MGMGILIMLLGVASIMSEKVDTTQEEIDRDLQDPEKIPQYTAEYKKGTTYRVKMEDVTESEYEYLRVFHKKTRVRPGDDAIVTYKWVDAESGLLKMSDALREDVEYSGELPDDAIFLIPVELYPANGSTLNMMMLGIGGGMMGLGIVVLLYHPKE